MLSLLVLEVPSFLFAYFTRVALKHGVNEVKNMLFTLCLRQLILSATILEDKVLALLLTLTSPITIYPANGLSCSFLLNLQRFFLSKFDRKLPKLHILIQSLALFAVHHFCNYPMNDKIITFI